MSVMPGGGDRRRASQMPMSCPVGAVSSRALRPLRVKGHPFIGNTWQIFRRPWSFIQDAYRALGPAYRVTIKGNDAVVLAGPEVRELYSEAGDNFLNRAFFYGRLQQELQARELIFRTRGERHRMMRHCASLAFSRHISAAHVPAAAAEMLCLFEGLERGQRHDVLQPCLPRSDRSRGASARRLRHATDSARRGRVADRVNHTQARRQHSAIRTPVRNRPRSSFSLTTPALGYIIGSRCSAVGGCSRHRWVRTRNAWTHRGYRTKKSVRCVAPGSALPNRRGGKAMAAADEVLAEIVSAILDGTPVDWELVDRLTASARPGAGQRAPGRLRAWPTSTAKIRTRR